jgi:predicted Zn-dependent protease
MVSFFQRLPGQDAQKRNVSVLFASHPQTADRMKQTEENIATYLPARPQATLTTAEFQAIKTRVAELVGKK